MELEFVCEVPGIYRLKVPFYSVYTSVFLICTETKKILFDCATTKEDVEGYIIPALGKLGIAVTDIDYLVISHSHSDHAGGKEHLLRHAPGIEVVTNVVPLPDGIEIYPLPGHAEDCIGILDTRSGTLISADGLQGAGIGKYRAYFALPDAYCENIERIRVDERIQRILFSHEYEPWYRNSMIGRDEIIACLDTCLEYVK